MRFSLYTCISAGLVGSILYSLGGYFTPWGKWLVFLGRFIQGLWTGGQQAIEQAYITECIDKDENLAMIADLGAAAVLGFVLGPIIGLIGGYINFSIGGFYVDEYTSCGYFQAFFTIIMFLGTFFLFQEIPREYRRGLQEDQQEEDDLDESVDVTEAEQDENIKEMLRKDPDEINFAALDSSEKETLVRMKPNMKGVLVSILIFLIHFNGFAVQETITTPISTDILHKYTDTLDYPESFAYILFAASGVLSLITFLVLRKMNGFLSDKAFVMLSSIMGFIGFFMIMDFSPRIIEPARFIVGFGIVSVTFIFGRGVTLTMYSKIIGKHKAGVYMGYMLAIGAISRVVGPFWSIQTLAVSPSLTFGICAFLFLVNIVAQWWFSDCLNAHWSYYIDQFEAQKTDINNSKIVTKKAGSTSPTIYQPYTRSPGAVYITDGGKKNSKNKIKHMV